MEKYNICLLGVCETWLNDSIKNAELLLDGYNIHRIDRDFDKAGGLCFIVKKGIISHIENVILTPVIELIHISIDNIKSKSIQCILIYKPPSSSLTSFINALTDFLNNINYSSLPILLFGDFNHDLLKINKARDPLIQCLKSYCLSNMHNLPTRVTSNSQTCIDWLLCNNLSENNVKNIKALDVGFSDHRLVTFNYKKSRNKKQPCVKKVVPVYSNNSVSTFCNSIQHYHFRSDINFESFISSIHSLHSNCFNFKTISIYPQSNTLNYLSPKYKHSAVIRDNLLTNYRKTLNPSIFDQYKLQRKKTNILAKIDKKNYLTSEITKHQFSNPKKMWNVLNCFFKDKSDSPAFITFNDRELSDNHAIADAFNVYFSSVISNLLCDIYGFIPLVSDINSILHLSSTSSFSFHFQPCFPFDIIKHFSYFKINRIDNNYLSHQLFLMHPHFFAEKIAFYINSSFSSCIFPSFLKISEIIPIHKKNSVNASTNYRPISLLPTLSKIIEKIVASQINEYIVNNKLLNSNQFGFDSGNSTETALLTLLNKVYSFINLKRTVVAVFLDYSKAFDSISHYLLCYKLKKMFHFSNGAIKFIYSYLSDRWQYVNYNGSCSSLQKVNFGVPQGSILGPLLFKLFINDIDSSLQFSSSILYADDTVILISGNDVNLLISQLNQDLHNISEYCFNNQLCLNASKSAVLILNNPCSYNFHQCFKINNNFIPIASQVRYLGYVIDADLKFKSHLTNIISKISSCNSILARSSSFINKHSLHLLYRSIGLSHVLYSKSILITLSNNCLKPLTRNLLHSGAIIENCLMKNVEGNYFNLYFILRYYYFIFIFKIIRCNFSHQIRSLLVIKPHSYQTRNDHRFFLPRFMSSSCKNSFSFFACRMWNTLPSDIANSKSLSNFKSSLEIYLTSTT